MDCGKSSHWVRYAVKQLLWDGTGLPLFDVGGGDIPFHLMVIQETTNASEISISELEYPQRQQHFIISHFLLQNDNG